MQRIRETRPTNYRPVERLRKLIVTLTTLIVAVASNTMIGLSSASAAPSPPGSINTRYVAPNNPIYKRFHVNVPGLPEAFQDTDPEVHYFHTLEADGKRVIYCIEIQNHTFTWSPVPSDSPARPLSREQQILLEHVLAQGPEFMDPDDDDAVRRYSAAQIVAWLITEGLYAENSVLDLVLFPATGDYPDTAGFAQTLEIGRLGRSFLNYAWAQLSESSTTQPSFTSTTPDTAPLHTMTPDGSGSFTLDLVNSNGSLEDNLFAGRLSITDSAGLDIAVTGNTMTITGTPAQNALITMTGRNPVGKLQYLQTAGMQESARYMFVDHGNAQYYFKLEKSDATPPTTPTTPGTPGTPSTPGSSIPPSTPGTPGESTTPATPSNPAMVATGSTTSRNSWPLLAGIALLVGGVCLLLASIGWRRNDSGSH